MFSCSTCRGPITGTGLTGRPWPGRTAARYCCYGCLSLGEQEQHEATSTAASRWKLDGIAIRLGLSLLIVGQSMIFGLALNLNKTHQSLRQTQSGRGSSGLQVGGQGSWSSQYGSADAFGLQGVMRSKK